MCSLLTVLTWFCLLRTVSQLFDDLCFELAEKIGECVIRSEVTLCS